MRFPLIKQTIHLGNNEITLLVPNENAVKEAYQKGEIEFPYWSQVWPASKALAQFLLNHPAYTSGKKVLEIGAGLGLPSFIAAQNASSVLCTDYAPDAVAIANQSAQHHRLQNFQSAVLDWHHIPDNLDVDVLLLSDINYEPAALKTVQALVHELLSKKTIVILSTPQRLMAKSFIASLLELCIAQEQITILHAGQNVSISILVLQK